MEKGLKQKKWGNSRRSTSLISILDSFWVAGSDRNLRHFHPNHFVQGLLELRAVHPGLGVLGVHLVRAVRVPIGQMILVAHLILVLLGDLGVLGAQAELLQQADLVLLVGRGVLKSQLLLAGLVGRGVLGGLRRHHYLGRLVVLVGQVVLSGLHFLALLANRPNIEADMVVVVVVVGQMMVVLVLLGPRAVHPLRAVLEGLGVLVVLACKHNFVVAEHGKVVRTEVAP